MQISHLILASNSPRRKELLALGGRPFDVSPASVNEELHPDEAPREYVQRLATEKADAVSQAITGGSLILAADTTVILDGRVLGKPADAIEARGMLQSLRGRTHTVFTAISMQRTADGARLSDLAATEVPMREYSDAEIDAYAATGDPLDKAGSYAIQHAGFHPVAEMTGCLANVIGLPLCHLQRSLEKWDLEFNVDLAEACQQHLNYACPVAEKILAWEL